MKKYNAVGAYIYAGGFTLGMRKHFNVLAHLEDGEFGVATVRKNMTDLPVHTIPDDWPLDELRGKCDVCYANPPCAPWSTAGSRAEVGKERTGDHRQLWSLVEDLDPTIWVWESVTQAYLGDHTELSQWISANGLEAGYNVYHFLHDVKFMGLPQQRRRVLTVLSKVNISWPLPSGDIKTVRDALAPVNDPGDVPPFMEQWEDWLPKVGQGKRLRNVVLAEQGPPAPGFLIHRASWDKPSRTVLGGVHVIHPEEHRFMGTNENAALCGYPLGYEFVGNTTSKYQQIARAVTPVLGDYLGKTLVKALDDNLLTPEPAEFEVNYMAKGHRVDDYRMLSEFKRIR